MTIDAKYRSYLFGDQGHDVVSCEYLGRRRSSGGCRIRVDVFVVVREGETRSVPVPEGNGPTTREVEGTVFDVEVSDHDRCACNGKRYEVRLFECAVRVQEPDLMIRRIATERFEVTDVKDIRRTAFQCIRDRFPAKIVEPV